MMYGVKAMVYFNQCHNFGIEIELDTNSIYLPVIDPRNLKN
jgi:hypothetical protein